MEIAQKELQNIITPDKPKEITPQLIIEVVSRTFPDLLRSDDLQEPKQRYRKAKPDCHVPVVRI